MFLIQTVKEINSNTVTLKEAKIGQRKVSNSHLAVNKNSLKPQVTKQHAPFPVLATTVNNESQPGKRCVMATTPVNKVELEPAKQVVCQRCI